MLNTIQTLLQADNQDVSPINVMSLMSLNTTNPAADPMDAGVSTPQGVHVSTPTSTQLSGLMSTDLQELLNLITFIVIQAVILFPGIFLNALNIYVFLRVGLGDTVAVSFFALSLTDMGCLIIAAYNWLCYTLYRLPGGWSVDMFSLMYLGVWYFQAVYDVSMLITTYTAVQKCCCITSPLHFKSVFTKTRTKIIITIFWAFCIASYAPLLATQGLQKTFNSKTNSSIYTIWFAANREEIVGANDIIVRIILQNACEAIVITCLFILIYSLRRQSQFRHSASVQSFSSGSQFSSRDALNKISAKELQVIKSVTLVSTIFVTCNFPRIVLSVARTVVPEMDTFRRYHNIHLTLQMIRRVIEVSGASGNFIIYYRFNTRFKDVVSSIFT
ncbi:uncharacterized protein LOC131938755 [Physella acuta]|uniref:uncharacterized protein LOC131938755 n=1 Tax=Physella acuta TaxID=109671 RepID=UPI0027DC3C36|nr:uncharacterized protein LOC131938755 [Physella acuta]